jgi:membrane-bound serine protease (ClpP class)
MACLGGMLLALAIAGLFFLPQPWSVIGVAVAASIEVGEVLLWRRFLRRYRVQTGAEGLVGEPAEVVAPLVPNGTVRLRGEIWRARSGLPVEVGERVRVVSVDGLTLEVEPGERHRDPG